MLHSVARTAAVLGRMGPRVRSSDTLGSAISSIGAWRLGLQAAAISCGSSLTTTSTKLCNHEITLAMARCAQRPDFVLPIRRTSKPMPEGYGHIQHVDAAEDPKFIDPVLARVTA
jgi:hypothetical protein